MGDREQEKNMENPDTVQKVRAMAASDRTDGPCGRTEALDGSLDLAASPLLVSIRPRDTSLDLAGHNQTANQDTGRLDGSRVTKGCELPKGVSDQGLRTSRGTRTKRYEDQEVLRTEGVHVPNGAYGVGAARSGRSLSLPDWACGLLGRWIQAQGRIRLQLGRLHLDSIRLDGLVFGTIRTVRVFCLSILDCLSDSKSRGGWLKDIGCGRQELRSLLVKPRSREGSVSERLCNVWLDDARDELVIVYETIKKLCVGSHIQTRLTNGSSFVERPDSGVTGTSSVLSPRTSVLICVLMDSHGRSVCADGHTRTATDVLLGVRQHTQDVRGCPCVSVSINRTSVGVHQYTYQHVGRWTQHADPSLGLFGTSVGVRQHTRYVCVCPSEHTGRPWLSVCVRQHTKDVRGCQYTYQHVGPWTQHADPSHGLFGTSVAVRVCPCVSVSTHMTTVAVHQYTYQHVGPWTQHADPSHGLFGTSVCVRHHTQDVRSCLCVSVSTHRTSVAVHQYTYQQAGPWIQHAGPSRGLFGLFWPTWAVCSVYTGRPWVSASTHRTSVAVCGCPSAHTGRPWLSLCIRVCLSAHTGRLWLSISTHISTLVLGLSTLALPMDCSGDFGPRGLSVQYTQDVRGCSSAHTGRLCVSVITHRKSVAVRVCPSAHTGRPWLSTGTHISTLVLGLSTLTLPVDFSGDFGSLGLSVQYTQDVCGCPPAHIGRPWLSVCVRLCLLAHTRRPWLSISTHISTLVLGLSTLTLPLDCLGDFWPTWAVCSVHTRRTWVSASTHRTFVAVRGCPSAHIGRPCVSVSTHKTSVCVRVCPSAHTGRLWLSISTHISTLVHGLSTLTLPVDCSGDFGPRGLSVQYTKGCPWVSTRTHRCPVLSVCVCLCPSVSVNTHSLWLSVFVRVCPSAHTRRLWLSISTHISTLVLGLSMLTLPVDCSGDFGPRGLSVQYTQDIRVCPPAHTGRPWLSVCVRVCPSVSVSTHRTSVAVHQYTYQHDVRGCPPAHTGRPWLSVSTHRTSMAVRVCLCVSVCIRQHTQDVCGCPSAHTGRPCVSISTHKRLRHSVCVRVCPSSHIGRPWLSISTHISTLVLGLSDVPQSTDHYMEPAQHGVQDDVRAVHQEPYQAHWSLGLSNVDTFPRTVWVISGTTWSVLLDSQGLMWVSDPYTQGRPVAVRGVCVVWSVCVRQHTHDTSVAVNQVHISARWSLDSARGPLSPTHRRFRGGSACTPNRTVWLSRAAVRHPPPHGAST
ncbi:hypothetical protein IGI04_030313 [Brassica rapa subsp. trilocularis]|uniref:Uncharacterized protein n=1 Tax=Brassica rapa subsp. trilocularis TaxID=1813537 RepID=A0ABQ7LQC3_BRACM|nr:hypothetical protein IGI04_030313 [Brassica rapa subsp. trilocularis]